MAETVFRFSSAARRVAVEFVADTPDRLAAAALEAAAEFRARAGRWVHRGEIHQTMYECTSAEVHVRAGDRWYNLGQVDQTPNGVQLWEPAPVYLPAASAPSVEALAARDEMWVRLNAPGIWSAARDTLRWISAADGFVGRVMHSLDDALDAASEMTAAEVAREFGVDGSTVRRACINGWIPARKADGRTWLIRRADAERRWGKRARRS